MKNKNQSGEVVVEASIIVTLVLIVITIMLYVGMILYQQTLVSVMANQTASNIAQVYGNNLKDPFSGYVDPDRVYQSITYSNMKTDAYMTVLERKANIFAQYRLKSSRILVNGTSSVEVEVVKKPNELLKSQIVVTIRDHYDVPLVGMFGTSGLVEFASSGRADCVDILEYINGVEAVGDPEESNVYFLPDSKNCTVTFVPDRDNPGNTIVETVLKGHSILSSNRYTHCVMPTDPQKGDLEFAGWFLENGQPFTGTVQIENNIVVYGSWKCEIILDANGGTVNGNPTHTMKVAYGSRVTLPQPVRDGFGFINWTDSQGDVFVQNDTPVTTNLTLKANWECYHKKANGSSKIAMAERKQYFCKDVGGRADSYELYKCADCAYEYKVAIENKHYIHSDYLINTHELIAVNDNRDDFTAQCNVNHLNGTVTGTTGSYDGGFVSASISKLYHITCAACGMRMPPVWWTNINGTNDYREIYWTSYRDSRTKTVCRPNR